MAQTKITDPVTYIILVLIVGVFIGIISFMGSSIISSDYNELTAESITYITGANMSTMGINESVYAEYAEAPVGASADNKVEFSLDFVFGRKGAEKLRPDLF